jgi:hypothetical protein
MATVPTQRFIKPEDFDTKDQALIGKLSFPINTFMQQVITAFTKQIDFNNLNMQINTFTVRVNATGQPTTPVQFTFSSTTKPIGMVCINAINQTANTRFPVATPFPSYSTEKNLITVSNIAGIGVPTGQVQSDSYTITTLTIFANIPTT